MNVVDTERLKYQAIWRQAWYRKRCHSLELWRDHRDIFPDHFQSALDIGCGTGRLFDLWNRCGIDAWAVDIASNAIDADIHKRWQDRIVLSPLWTMSWPQRFDAGICTDVMEHIPEGYVGATLRCIYRSCRVTVFKIANFPSIRNGYQLHMTLKPADWWLMQMREIGGKPVRLAYETPHEEYLIRWN